MSKFYYKDGDETPIEENKISREDLCMSYQHYNELRSQLFDERNPIQDFTKVEELEFDDENGGSIFANNLENDEESVLVEDSGISDEPIREVVEDSNLEQPHFSPGFLTATSENFASKEETCPPKDNKNKRSGSGSSGAGPRKSKSRRC